MTATGDLIRGVRFAPVRMGRGYDMHEVDLLLDRLAQLADAGEPVGDLASAARFSTVRFQEGYAQGEVDAFLERLAADEAPAPRPVLESVVQERRGLFARWRRR